MHTRYSYNRPIFRTNGNFPGGLFCFLVGVCSIRFLRLIEKIMQKFDVMLIKPKSPFLGSCFRSCSVSGSINEE
jgi:hypothetical protein